VKVNRLVNILVISLAVVWSLFIIAMVNRAGEKEERLIDEIAVGQAESIFQVILDMRRWAAEQGGVYVVPSQHTPPNPHLKHPMRDIETTDGMDLTLVNPSYMTRQISDIGFKRRGVRIRLISLSPIRPENKAVGWEQTALESFNSGQNSYSQLFEDEETGYIYRYMAPLAMEEPCKTCHFSTPSDDLWGAGIGITFPVDELVEGRIQVRRLNRITFASLWLFGLFLLAGLTIVLDKYWLKQT
jgi:hypothetical protein